MNSNFHFMLIPDRGDAVRSVIVSYNNPDVPLKFGAELAKRIMTEDCSGAFQMNRPELKTMIEGRPTKIEVVVINTATKESVAHEMVHRN